jgi:hypothetical protein
LETGQAILKVLGPPRCGSPLLRLVRRLTRYSTVINQGLASTGQDAPSPCARPPACRTEVWPQQTQPRDSKRCGRLAAPALVKRESRQYWWTGIEEVRPWATVPQVRANAWGPAELSGSPAQSAERFIGSLLQTGRNAILCTTSISRKAKRQCSCSRTLPDRKASCQLHLPS